MFGKRNRPAPPEPPRRDPPPGSSGGGPSGPPSGDTRFPWDGDPSYVACNLATGNLANNLVAWMTREGRVHAETYVAASGAIAGYAAQQTLLAETSALPPGMHTVTTSSGENYLFGDPLNNMLLAKSEAEADGRVWPRAAGAAVSTGIHMSRLPKLDDMFRHVAASLGGPQEGLPSTEPGHQPAVPARQLLALVWPHVATFFKADFDDIHRRFGPVPPKWWCAVAAYATARPILDVNDVLDPAISLTILMETAIYASKLTRF